MKGYFVIFNVPQSLGNGDNGFFVKAKNIKEAKIIALKKCLRAYRPKYIEATFHKAQAER